MTSSSAARPASTEYAPYYGRYVSLVADGNIVETLEKQMKDTLDLLGSIAESRGGHRYEEGKWSIKEVIGHLLDTERVFGYRALRFARGDRAKLAGIEQDGYVKLANFDSRTLAGLAAEYGHVRGSTIALFRPLDDEAWSRTGVASDNEVSVRALAFVIAGHELHHMGVIRERYL